MDKIFLKSRAKINLTLNILGKREDGYHDLESLFQKISLYDEIFIEKIDDDKCTIDTNFNEIKTEDNIIYKAYLKMKELYNIKGIKVRLNKNIPSQAGMAGGSTNCASFLIGINKLYDLKLNISQLSKIGSSLGADVVPCMYDGIIKANGIGDIISKIDNGLDKYYIIIIKPNFSCSTKKMFEKIDTENINQQINTGNMIKAIKKNMIKEIGSNLYNVFEEVLEQQEELKYIKNELKENGTIGTLLTGSGSAIYGIFDEKSKAKNTYRNLINKFKHKKDWNIYYSLSYSGKLDKNNCKGI